MKQFKDLVQYIIDNGEVKQDRTGVGTVSIFGYQDRYNLQDGFPLVTLKRTYWKGVVHELLWFLQGNTNIKYLVDNNVHIWDEWADEDGNLGPVYGKQWRDWVSNKKDDNGEYIIIDQIKELIEGIKTNPHSRRHIVSAWNVGEISNMALPPCHSFFQFYVSTTNKLSIHLYMRSNDVFLGRSFNLASYALLNHMIAHLCGLEVGEFIFTSGDTHLYLNHMDQVKEMMSREPKALPKLKLVNVENVKSIDDFRFEHFELEGYDPHPNIKAPVAI